MITTDPNIVDQLQNISIQAGEAIMAIYNSKEQGIELKSDLSPLTLADQNANEIIVKELTKLFPEIPIISEENKTVEYEVRKKYNQYWLVDPLDGTKEFIKRNGEFTVNIALISDGRPVMGFVYVPVTKEMYYAIKDQGAYKKVEGVTHKLQAMTFSIKDPYLKIVASRSHLNDETKKILSELNHPEIVSKGSSLKFLIIAEGKAHFYPRLAPTMEWDTGAAQIILEESGGAVVQFTSRASLSYNKENLLNPYFLAYGDIEDKDLAI